jgi:hypothetical protein
MSAQSQEDGNLGQAVDLIHLLKSAGGHLRERTAAACERAPAWTVLVCDSRRIDLMGAPLDVVLAVLELAPGQPLVVTLPPEALSRALGLEGAGEAGELGAQLAVVPPEGWCLCLVVTQRDTRVIQLPRSGALPAVVAGASGAAKLMTSGGETEQ